MYLNGEPSLVNGVQQQWENCLETGESWWRLIAVFLVHRVWSCV